MKNADVRLFVPQAYFQQINAGHMTVDAKFVGLYGIKETKRQMIPYHNPSSLLILFNVKPNQR